MSRYPAEHKEATRRRILAASEALMKDRGTEAASVEAVMRRAGLTVGGFYAHFASKDDLAAETLLFGLESSFGRMIAGLEGRQGGDWLRGLIRAYLAQAEDDDLARACPLTLLLADVARADEGPKARFAAATRAMLERVAPHFPERDGLSRREVALATYAALVGAVEFARASPSRTARRAILASCERMLSGWLGLDDDARPAPKARGAVSRERSRSRRRA
jgi:TetR/AcrR family transcriptional repressor of nem operon